MFCFFCPLKILFIFALRESHLISEYLLALSQDSSVFYLMEVVCVQALQWTNLFVDLQKTLFDLLFDIVNKSMSSFPSNIQKLLEILQEFLNIRASINLFFVLNHLRFDLRQLSLYIISSTNSLSKRTRHVAFIWILINQLNTLHLS